MAIPKRSETRVIINPPAAWLGVRNAILWGKGKRYHVPDFRGPLSIKTVVRGSARWSTNEADRLVDESTYLVLNSGQTYSVTIDSLETVETFCLFFRRGLTEDVSRVDGVGPTIVARQPRLARELSASADSAARGDNPSQGRVGFFETLHPHDTLVSPLIRRIYGRLKDKTASGPWFEDQFLEVAAALSKVHGAAE